MSSTPAASGQPASPGVPPPSAVPDAGFHAEACVDRWLASKELDRYGHPEGTMYAGGTPLFDERTGTSTDRIAYLLARHPELKRACPDARPASPPAEPDRR